MPLNINCFIGDQELKHWDHEIHFPSIITYRPSDAGTNRCLFSFDCLHPGYLGPSISFLMPFPPIGILVQCDINPLPILIPCALEQRDIIL